MLNLLFISNSPKVRPVQDIMQPLIKAKIDVVADFDHGLKDVFEKRPATVIIQEQISGVTGESVARHIQLLLGNGAPKFVLLHEGNSKIKPIPGLFEHIIDLNQPGSAMAVEIMSALKQICGVEWDKVVIDLLPPVSPTRPSERTLQNLADEPASPKLSDQAVAPRKKPEYLASASAGVEKEVSGSPPTAIKQGYSTVQALSAQLHPAKAVPPREPEKSAQAPRSVAGVQATTPTVNDFTISGSATVHSEMIPEDILLAFEENCRTRSRKFILISVVVLLGAIAGGGYLFRNQPRLRSLYQTVMPTLRTSAPKAGQADKSQIFVSPQVVQKPLSSVVAAPTPVLPSFVSASGRDGAFSTSKPGWERYVDAQRDIRIFRKGSGIKALQVVAVPGQVISSGFLNTVLNEVTGSANVTPGSTGQQQGYLTERSRVGQHADLLVYRNIHTKAIIAFVVSLD